MLFYSSGETDVSASSGPVPCDDWHGSAGDNDGWYTIAHATAAAAAAAAVTILQQRHPIRPYICVVYGGGR